MDQTIEIWRACGIGFFAIMITFTIGLVIGKEIGWNQCGRFLRPNLFPPRKRNH